MAGEPRSSAAGEFRMEIEQRGEAAIVRLIGSIRTQACEPLQADLLKLVEKPTPKVIVDMSRLDFICSLGLGAMVAAHLRSRHYKGSLRVVSPDPSIRALLEITRLNKLFPPYDSVEAALGE